MAADGELSVDKWRGRSLESACPESPSPLPVSSLPVAPAGKHDGRASSVQLRARSPTPDHVSRCISEFGSERESQKQCARCGWIAHRESFYKRFQFFDGDGIAELLMKADLDC